MIMVQLFIENLDQEKQELFIIYPNSFAKNMVRNYQSIPTVQRTTNQPIETFIPIF